MKALRKASFNPLTLVASRYLFPEDSIFKLSGMLGAVKGVDDFQKSVMAPCVKSIMDRTSDALIVEGIENVSDISGGFVVISNHRDIVMDPALLQYSFFLNDICLTELCVGLMCCLRCCSAFWAFVPSTLIRVSSLRAS